MKRKFILLLLIITATQLLNAQISVGVKGGFGISNSAVMNPMITPGVFKFKSLEFENNFMSSNYSKPAFLIAAHTEYVYRNKFSCSVDFQYDYLSFRSEGVIFNVSNDEKWNFLSIPIYLSFNPIGKLWLKAGVINHFYLNTNIKKGFESNYNTSILLGVCYKLNEKWNINLDAFGNISPYAKQSNFAPSSSMFDIKDYFFSGAISVGYNFWSSK